MDDNINLNRQEYTALFSGLQQIQTSMLELKESIRESKSENSAALAKLESRLTMKEADLKALNLELARSHAAFSAGLRTAKFLLGGVFVVFAAITGHLYQQVASDHDSLVGLINDVKRYEVVRHEK